MSDPNATPILDGFPLAAGTTSAERVAPNSPDPITHTLALELGPCAIEPASLAVHPAVAPSKTLALVAAITGEQQVTLTWQAPVIDGNAPITRYRVYRLENGTNPKTVYTTNPSTTFVDDTVLPGNTYKYFVWAGNDASLWGPYSDHSNEVTVIGVPGIPGTPTIQSRGDRTLTLAWAPPTNDGGAQVTSYQIERQASSDGSAWGAWSTTKAGHNGTTFTDTGLTAGTYYRYRVAATNQAGTGPTSSASHSTRAITTPDAPGKPNGERRDNSTLTWSWAAPNSDGYAPITNYQVQISAYDDASDTWGAWEAA